MIHTHHRRLRSQGGGDEPTNTIFIPDPIHDWIHANPEKAKEAGLIVPEWVDPATVPITIPEEALRKVRTAVSGDQPKKPRQTFSIKVPKKDPDGVEFTENGAEVLDALMQAAREKLVKTMGWQDDVPAYFVMTAVLHDWLTS